MMRQERTDTNHLGTELFYEKNVLYQVVDGLSRTSHHDASSRLESDAFQIVQTTQTVGQRHVFRVQAAVMCFVVRFVAQQIAIGTCLKKTFVGKVWGVTE